jgi:hypothetical protein
MKATKLGAAITLLLGWPAAQANKTELLLYQCEQLVQTMRPNGSHDIFVTQGGHCIGYMEALIDVANTGTDLWPFPCGTDRITSTQLARLFVRYGEAHPEKLNLPPLTLPASAISEAYPCKQ